MTETHEQKVRNVLHVLQIAVVVLLPGVGFIANEVISNSRDIAVMTGTKITFDQAVRLVNESAALVTAQRERTLAARDRTVDVQFSAIQKDLTDMKRILEELRKKQE